MRQRQRGKRERTSYVHIAGHWVQGTSNFSHVIKKHVGLNHLKIEKYSLFILSIWAFVFNVEDDEKTKSRLTFGWSCQITLLVKVSQGLKSSLTKPRAARDARDMT